MLVDIRNAVLITTSKQMSDQISGCSPADRHRHCRLKGPRHVPLAALGPSQCRWRKILCSPGCRKSKRPDSAGSNQASICTSGFGRGDAGLALNFRGNEHVPPSSHTDLWPDNCTDSRLLGLKSV